MAKSPPNGGLFPPEIVSKPSSVEYGHLSSRTVAGTFQRYSRPPPGEQPLRQRPNLAPDGVYTARRVAAAPVSSYLPFPSLQNNSAVCFCCTFLEVAFTGRYPASCSMVLGLSSWHKTTRPYSQLRYLLLYKIGAALSTEWRNILPRQFLQNACNFAQKHL